MKKRAGLAAVITFALVAALAIYLQPAETDAPGDFTHASLEGVESNISDRPGDSELKMSAAHSSNSSMDRPMAAASLLPPPSARLADAFQELKSLALGGDARAACRLTKEIAQCKMNAKAAAVAKQMTDSLADPSSTSTGDGVGVVASLMNHNETVSPKCEETTREMFEDAYEYQSRAADADPRFDRWLAANPALDPDDVVNQMEQWANYKARARRYFDRSLAERRAEDLGLLLMVYGPDSLPGLRPPYQAFDPEKFVALVSVAVAHGVDVPAPLRDAADQLVTKGTVAKADLLNGWKGEADRSFDRSITGAMHPTVVTPEFCEGE